jgi:hypothetical protein
LYQKKVSHWSIVLKYHGEFLLNANIRASASDLDCRYISQNNNIHENRNKSPFHYRHFSHNKRTHLHKYITSLYKFHIAYSRHWQIGPETRVYIWEVKGPRSLYRGREKVMYGLAAIFRRKINQIDKDDNERARTSHFIIFLFTFTPTLSRTQR